MKIAEIDLRDTKRFSDLFLDYIERKNPRLEDFYQLFPQIENFKTQIDRKVYQAGMRQVLCTTLHKQYKDKAVSTATQENLDALHQENTFTITTGHQLNIFTGPLYFIYKIATVIATCRQLQSAYPQHHFVPVYWMASEDHDYDEINHFRLEGKKYTWATDQIGAVGAFDPHDLEVLAKEIPGIPQLFIDAYGKSATLAEACFKYVNDLFGDHGLVVVDANVGALKRQFIPMIEDDIFNHTANTTVSKTTSELENLGYKTQIYPREINFFYLLSGIRERIEKNDEGYQVLNTSISFSEVEIREEIHRHPERFSPNVVLRPLYQEVILPNLAYIGGPSEVAYWFQLKDIFDVYNTPFPILMPRNFAALLNHNTVRKAEKLGLEWRDLFQPAHDLHKKMTLTQSEKELLIHEHSDKIAEIFDKIRSQAQSIDKTLVPHVEAQKQRSKNMLDTIEKKFIRAEKRRQADHLRQVDAVLNVLFPNHSLQERQENFIPFYLTNERLIGDLIDTFDPFNYCFYLFRNV